MTVRSGSAELAAVRRSRRHPRPTQFDYLHLRRLVRDIRKALARVDGRVVDVLDIYCGSRPYEDLLPAGACCIGIDVPGNPYGVADVVSDEFLPFADKSFDVVTCYEAFHYVADPRHGVSEIRRVLRPGGTALITVPLVWEYNRGILEHRYTGPELEALFAGWKDVEVVENGGRIVVWATLTGTILERLRSRIPDLWGVGRVTRAAFVPFFLALNVVAGAVADLDERHARGDLTLPMNLLITARRPLDECLA
jgi:SAM-dependent methyltransferase